MTDYSIFLLLSIFAASILYSSVGHGGASGYLAAMALFGVHPEIMKPVALVMNISVTILIIYKCYDKFDIDWKLLTSLVVVSVPFAFLGGILSLDSEQYKLILGVVLLFAAWRMFITHSIERKLVKPPWPIVVAVGASLGFASGVTGIGGGIFLSPLLLLLGWTSVKDSIPVVAAFVLVNSISGLLGYMTSGGGIPETTIMFILVVAVGAYIGIELASRRLSSNGLRNMLGIVLVVASSKMLITA